jgi:hypothetical protein
MASSIDEAVDAYIKNAEYSTMIETIAHGIKYCVRLRGDDIDANPIDTSCVTTLCRRSLRELDKLYSFLKAKQKDTQLLEVEANARGQCLLTVLAVNSITEDENKALTTEAESLKASFDLIAKEEKGKAKNPPRKDIKVREEELSARESELTHKEAKFEQDRAASDKEKMDLRNDVKILQAEVALLKEQMAQMTLNHADTDAEIAALKEENKRRNSLFVCAEVIFLMKKKVSDFVLSHMEARFRPTGLAEIRERSAADDEASARWSSLGITDKNIKEWIDVVDRRSGYAHPHCVHELKTKLCIDAKSKFGCSPRREVLEDILVDAALDEEDSAAVVDAFEKMREVNAKLLEALGTFKDMSASEVDKAREARAFCFKTPQSERR